MSKKNCFVKLSALFHGAPVNAVRLAGVKDVASTLGGAIDHTTQRTTQTC